MNLITNFKNEFIKNDSLQEQILVLELKASEIRMDIYQHGELSSRIIQLELSIHDNGIGAYFSELVRVLRSELLWRLEDTAELVFLLPEDWCYVDMQEMPALDNRELQRTLEWELEQYVPWPRNNYYFDICSLGDDANTYMAAAAPQTVVDRIMKAGEELDVIIREISAGITIDGYFAGKPHPNLLPPKYKKRRHYHKNIKTAKIILVIAVVISVILTGATMFWRYWNMERVQVLQKELDSLAAWEQRMEWVEAGQKRLQHLQRIIGFLDKEQKPLLPQLELWGKTAGDSCWLERIETHKDSRELVLYGRGMDTDAVTAFLDKLNSSGLYKQVELVEIQADSLDTYASFVIRLTLKGVEK